MRTLYLFNMITLDGYFEGATKWDISWHKVDAEFNEFAIEQLNATDTLIFGRVTYEGMAAYWPTETPIKNDPIVANMMNSSPKVVFSRTMKNAEWNNTRVVKENTAQELANLKKQSGKDIGILGSANLASTLVESGLIDEYRVMINPVILGKGTLLFQGFGDRLNLRLLKARTFKSGNVLLCYGRE